MNSNGSPSRGKFVVTAIAIILAAGTIGFVLGRLTSGTPLLGSSIGHTASKAELLPTSSQTTHEGASKNAEPRPTWVQRISELHAAAEPGKPSPGFATLFKDLLDQGDPYNLGSLQTLMDGLRHEDLPQALALLKRANQIGGFRGASPNQHIVWNTLWARFGELDPAAAFAEIRNLRDVKYQGVDWAAKSVLQGWAQRDPASAAKGFLENLDLPNPNYTIQGLGFEWAKQDLPAAMLWVDQYLTDDAIHAAALRGMSFGVANRQGFREAVSWWEKLSKPDDRREVFDALNSMIQNRGPGVTLEDKSAMITAGRNIGMRDPQLEMRVALAYADTDPSVGANLFTKFPSPSDPTRYDAVAGLLTKWSRADDRKAADWVKDQEGQPWYDSAAAGIATALKDRDLAAAQQWLATIKSERVRDQLSKQLASPALER